MIYYTADEHYGHSNIIRHCNRPFDNVEEMNAALIANHNAKVKNDDDLTIHGGDFAWYKKEDDVINQLQLLRGKHILIRGNHDYWMPKFLPSHGQYREIMEHTYNKRQLVVIFHYAMRVWNKSHYNSWNLYGHSHGTLPPVGKQHDIGVDNNNFAPVSYDEIEAIMTTRDNNAGYLPR